MFEYLTYLVENDLDYHFDDLASDCLGDKLNTEECEEVQRKVNDCYDLCVKSGICIFIIVLGLRTAKEL